MIHFFMGKDLNEPAVIKAEGDLVTITTDIALAVAQVYHSFNNPVVKELFKLGMGKLFSPDSFVWGEDTKTNADFKQVISYDARELRRQAEEMRDE